MECTFHGLHYWHKDLFEKFGWAVLLHEKGEMTKIHYLKVNVDKFIESANNTIKSTKDSDRVHDLEILKTDIEILKKKLDVWFKEKKKGWFYGGNEKSLNTYTHEELKEAEENAWNVNGFTGGRRKNKPKPKC